MSKNKFLVVLVAVFATLACTSCSSIVYEEKEPYIYNSSKELYPGIYYVLNHDNARYRDVVISKFDTENNVYVFTNVSGADGLNLANFTLTVSVNSDGSLQYDIADEKVKAVSDLNYQRVSSFSTLFDIRTVTNAYNTYLPQVMNDEALYETTKSEADSVLSLVSNKTSEKQPAVTEMSEERPSVSKTQTPIENTEVSTEVKTNGKLIYPVLGSVYNNLKENNPAFKDSYATSFDFFGNSMKIAYVKTYDEETLQAFTYTVTVYLENDVLKIAIEDIKENKDVAVAMVMGNKGSVSFDPNGILDLYKKGFESVFKDDASYEQAKTEFLSDPINLYLALDETTDIGRESIIESLADTKLSINTELKDVEKNVIKQYEKFTYKASAYIIWTELIHKQMVINYYTNDKTIAIKAKDAKVIFEGYIASYNPVSHTLVITTEK